MTPEQALIAQAGPYILASRTRALIENEICKGCTPLILPDTVALEPCYSPIDIRREELSPKQVDYIFEPAPDAGDLIRHQVWVSPEWPFSWDRCELFLKQLLSVSHRVGLEMVGNHNKIAIYLLCHKEDIPILYTSFRSRIEHCAISRMKESPLSCLKERSGRSFRFHDYFPSPPYSHLLTRPDELKMSTYECAIAALSSIKPPGMGMYQILFQPVAHEHNWHRNIEILLDLEYVVKLVGNVGIVQRYAQQAPSGDLRQMAYDVETKAHNDKPLFAAAFRVAFLGDDNAEEHMKSLDVFSNLFQHGGRPLNYLDETKYAKVLNEQQFIRMLLLGHTYRPGFLVNSSELAGLVHVPPASIAELFEDSLQLLEPIADCKTMLDEGTPIGVCNITGADANVSIPLSLRMRHTHMIGSSGTGKSLLEQHMILDDIKKGYGLAVLDPHGDLVEELLYHIPKEFIDKVIYCDPGDPDWVPLWNPIERIPGQDIGRMTDDLVGVLKSFVTDWGDRMEHILRHAIFALLHISGTTLLDISDLLRKKSKESDLLRKLIVEAVDNEVAHKFWKHDFDAYRSDEFGPPKHKLSKLLVSGTVSLMLSQPHSAFSFRRIMDEGFIFLANLSKLGSEVREILGGFMLSIMHATALSRSDVPVASRRMFHIFIDEAHRFVTDSLEDIIAETRKYGVSMTLAHQYMRQFRKVKIDALTGVGTTIVFNIDMKDAAYLGKDFRKTASLEDFINLGVGEAIVRCGTDIVRTRTPGPLPIPEINYKDEIIKQSRLKYCKPVHEVLRMVRRRNDRANQPFTPLVPDQGNGEGEKIPEEFFYDELHE